MIADAQRLIDDNPGNSRAKTQQFVELCFEIGRLKEALIACTGESAALNAINALLDEAPGEGARDVASPHASIE